MSEAAAMVPAGPTALAALHGRVFVTPPPWAAGDFRALLGEPSVFLLALPQPGSTAEAVQGREPRAFLLGRAIAGEAEILTLAVDPGARRCGLGRQLVEAFLGAARARGAERAFLEVAADNAPALGLYAAAGFGEAGRRRGYYRTPDGQRLDAIVMSRGLG
ncbi:GNAT family N-acetyltransferase [Cereibacter azotoformans]|nr:GNAT family N-acetyltransferase [Cereibacter azotoformans]AXQ94161.1 GNAT family N-acetyltransferase [Cereibacter sphaeroides]MBO4168033.1 GNAT family N-acetyltransferase [Cereibacter azotoformans]UIJ29697.1 GNAT family N-acetyltransferase [Cereibacter azotoformans]ULB10383.1 GNAT family N-acetyltransferase [Cereibacter azotoformans]